MTKLDAVYLWTCVTTLSDGSDVIDVFIEQEQDGKLQAIKLFACSPDDANTCVRKIKDAIEDHCLRERGRCSEHRRASWIAAYIRH
jgi:hypothetical protein